MDTKEQEQKQSLQQIYTRADDNRPYASLIIILVNGLLWFLTQILTSVNASSFLDALYKFFIGPININILTRFGSFDPRLIHQGEYWRIISAGFLHVAGFHIALTIGFLWELGMRAEKDLGTTRFVVIYFTTSIAGFLASYVLLPNTLTIGASGSICGVLGAYFVLFSRHHRAATKARIPALVAIWFLAVCLGALSFLPHMNYVLHICAFLWGVLLGLVIDPYYKDGKDIHTLNRTWPWVFALCITEGVIAYLILK